MYEVTIDNFVGPMDLLLHLIKEAKMDILDIKLEIIIDEYLDYIQKMNDMNLEVASSYLVMASELLEIKSKMLLPKDEEEEEEEDPKERLIRRLILYQQYQDQVAEFKKLEEERKTYYTKIPANLGEFQDDYKIPLENITLDDLTSAFEKFLERVEFEKPIKTKVTRKELSVEDRITSIKKRLKKEGKISFEELFETRTKEYIVVTFLAILEMAKNGDLRLIQDNNFDNIICEAV